MHMMGLANIPMIVLFGPTSADKFAPKITILKFLDSKKIHNTSDIEFISVDEVYNLIQFLIFEFFLFINFNKSCSQILILKLN